MASYFEACGISMGQRLASATRGNPRGHFEDRDFLDFHKELLKNRRVRTFSRPEKIVPDAKEAQKGAAIFRKKQQRKGDWGWKDPRTTLFLDYWRDVCPHAHFVLLYRDPAAVVDSLIRRGTDLQLKMQPWRAALSWLGYNRLLLDFWKGNSGRTSLINIAGFNRYHSASAAVLGEKLGAVLSKPYTVVYKPEEMSVRLTQKPKLIQSLVVKHYRRSMSVTYAELERAALISEKGPCREF